MRDGSICFASLQKRRSPNFSNFSCSTTFSNHDLSESAKGLIHDLHFHRISYFSIHFQKRHCFYNLKQSSIIWKDLTWHTCNFPRWIRRLSLRKLVLCSIGENSPEKSNQRNEIIVVTGISQINTKPYCDVRHSRMEFPHICLYCGRCYEIKMLDFPSFKYRWHKMHKLSV